MAVWNRFSSILFGGAIGAAARTAIEPQIEPARQLAWSNNTVRILDLVTLSTLVAEGLVAEGDAAKIAKRDGHPPENLSALVELQLAAPGIAELMTARRRDDLTAQEFSDGLGKLRIHPEFRDAVTALLDDRLSPQIVATAIVRGLIPDPGILPVPPPTEPGKVKSFPVFNVPAVKEAKAGGLDLERLSVLVGIFGRPMAPEGAAQAYWRGIIERSDFERAVAESDVRNEWRDAILEASRFILSPQDAAGLWLRGWIDEVEAVRLGALHGATPATMRALYLNRGRPATVRQTHIGYARGAVLAGFEGDEKGAALRAVQESDIRREWFDILYAARYTMPSAFVTRALTQAGTFTPAQAEKILLWSGWMPEHAAAASASWGGKTGSASTPWINRAATRLWTVAHDEFMAGNLDDAEARTLLDELNVPATEAGDVLALWTVERDTRRLELTPTQIKKAYKVGRLTLAQATDDLERRGMYPADVDTFLNE